MANAYPSRGSGSDGARGERRGAPVDRFRIALTVSPARTPSAIMNGSTSLEPVRAVSGLVPDWVKRFRLAAPVDDRRTASPTPFQTDDAARRGFDMHLDMASIKSCFSDVGGARGDLRASPQMDTALGDGRCCDDLRTHLSTLNRRRGAVRLR